MDGQVDIVRHLKQFGLPIEDAQTMVSILLYVFTLLDMTISVYCIGGKEIGNTKLYVW